jgi:hypothetical protein
MLFPPKKINQAGVAILISDKLDFRPKLIRRYKKGHFILIKGIIHQEEIAIVNLYVPNINVPNFIKQTLLELKVQIDFNPLLSPIDRSSRQKINKEILELNDTIDQMDLTDIYRVFHPEAAQYIFFQQPMELSSK